MSEIGNNTRIRELRDAFGSFMTGVTIISTAKEDGTPLGFTANSFSSVSLDPALLLVSIAKTSSNYQTFLETGHFAVNILSEAQKEISNTFARPCKDRFEQVQWHMSANQSPILEDVSAWFDCTMHQVVDAGDHAILIGKIEDFGTSGYAGLGYYRGVYFTPAKLSTEIISAPSVIISALIEHDNKVLLVETAQHQWTIPSVVVGIEGADYTLSQLLKQYQSDASANFIYAVYEDVVNKHQYISFLCNAPNSHAIQGQFVELSDLDQFELVNPALESMLARYRKESQLGNYGVYYGNASEGKVRQISSVGV